MERRQRRSDQLCTAGKPPHIQPERGQAGFAESQLEHAVPEDQVELARGGGEVGGGGAQQAGEGRVVPAERAVERQPEPKPSRSEAIRQLLERAFEPSPIQPLN